MAYFTPCPECGANLDPNERCEDCANKREKAEQKEPAACRALMVIPPPAETDPTPELTKVLTTIAPPLPLFSDEQIAAAVAAIENFMNTVIEITKRFVEAVAACLPDIVGVIKDVVMDMIPPKWWHYCKHGKKRRTRVKYEKRIRRTISDLFGESEAAQWIV